MFCILERFMECLWLVIELLLHTASCKHMLSHGVGIGYNDRARDVIKIRHGKSVLRATRSTRDLIFREIPGGLKWNFLVLL